MRRNYAIGTLFTALAIAGSAQNAAPGDWQKVLIPDGVTVYDSVNNVVWLADANLPAKILPDKKPSDNNFRFGLPVCPPLTIEPTENCVNPSGSMNYTSAVQWVQGMNDANYLGHHDWQLPTTPTTDGDCPVIGPNGNSFGFGCDSSALGYLYYTALGFKAPDTSVHIPDDTVGPFNNFQPYFYWSQSGGGGSLPGDTPVFSFNSGSQGGATTGNFMYALPMIVGDPFVWATPGGTELYVNPGGTSVYDPVTKITWVANANLAKTETFGLPRCKTAPDTTLCVAHDGSMNYESAMVWVNGMNAYEDPITNVVGYLGHIGWQLPPLAANCPIFGCAGGRNPMGNLYYHQLNFPAGKPVVEAPDIAVGPFRHVQPYLYWSCLADNIRDGCETAGPVAGSEWGFSFGNGFLGTEGLKTEYYVTAYYVVTAPPTKPPIPPKCPPTDPSCYQ
jgi:hypothetical protein